MIDARDYSFGLPTGGDELVLFNDVYEGFGLVGRIRGQLAGVSLADESRLQPVFLDETTERPRVYIGGCRLEVDPSSNIDQRITAPIGSVIIAPSGVSLIVPSNVRGSAYLTLHGDQLMDRYYGIAFSRWSLVRDRTDQSPAVIFQYDSLTVAPSAASPTDNQVRS